MECTVWNAETAVGLALMEGALMGYGTPWFIGTHREGCDGMYQSCGIGTCGTLGRYTVITA